MNARLTSLFADCINTIFFGEVCDICDGVAIYSLLAAIIRTLTIGVGILAVIGIMVTGISYLKSSGDAAKKLKARSRLINVGIGIIIYIILFGIAEFLIPGGVVSHPLASTDETARCPKVTHTDTTLRRTESPGNTSGTLPENPSSNRDDGNSQDDIVDRTRLKGSAPIIAKKTGVYPSEGKTRMYTFINIDNAIPYVYFDKSGGFDSIVGKIQRSNSNILIISNSYINLGPIISNGKIAFEKRYNKNLHQVFVVDEKGNVGYAPDKTPGSDLLTGNYLFTDAVTGKTESGHKAYSATTGWGVFYLDNGKDWQFRAPENKRQRTILCTKSNGGFTLINMAKDRRNGAGWGWNAKEMTTIAKRHRCVSAYNFDGGASTELAYRYRSNSGFTYSAETSASKSLGKSTRGLRGYLVFTSDNNPPYVR